MLHRLPTAVTSTTLTHTVDHSEDVGHLTMKIHADADLQFVLRACNTSGAVHGNAACVRASRELQFGAQSHKVQWQKFVGCSLICAI